MPKSKKSRKNVTLSGRIVRKTAPLIASALLTAVLPIIAKKVTEEVDKKSGRQV